MEITPLREVLFRIRLQNYKISINYSFIIYIKKEAPAFGCLLVEMYIF